MAHSHCIDEESEAQTGLRNLCQVAQQLNSRCHSNGSLISKTMFFLLHWSASKRGFKLHVLLKAIPLELPRQEMAGCELQEA